MNGEAVSTLSASALQSMVPQSVTGGECIDPSTVLSWLCQQCPLRREQTILRTERGYWRSQYDRVKAREAQLLAAIKELEAKLKLREDQLFGRKSEVCTSGNEQQTPTPTPRRKRGQQPGAPGHGRRRYEHLPVKEERDELPPEEQCCPRGGLPYVPFPGTEDAELVEVEVKAHVRRIKRPRSQRTCACPDLPVLITAPGPAKLIPKGAYGDSVWIQIVLDKFLWYRPTSRFLESLTLVGLTMSQGTITDGLKRLAPLFEPVYQAIVRANQQENHWHADETRWLVFDEIQGKVGYRWYLWVFRSASTVVYLLDPSRSATVPTAHLQDAQKGTLSVDRYQAYKTFVKDREGAFQ